MLVLSRKPGESILIGEEIEIRVLSIVGGKIKLGITAPPHVSVMRSEVVARMGGGEPDFVRRPLEIAW